MTEAPDELRLEGILTADEVAALERRYKGLFDGASPPSTVSLEDIESGDSSALALLLEWQSRAQHCGRKIRFEHPPESLRVIARLTGVAPLLGWKEGETHANSKKEGS